MRLVVFSMVVWLCACTEHGSGGMFPDPANPKACGGFAGETCGASEICDFPDNLCGATDGQGTCVPRALSCGDSIPQPTCGCDGVIHESACDAALAGVDVSINGGCAVPQGFFVCGEKQCAIANEYCEKISNNTRLAPLFTCKPLPLACGSFPSCACVATEQCGARCDGFGAEGMTLQCPVGVGG